MRAPLITILALTLLFCSCKTPRYVYAPSLPNQPSFEQKGDSKLGGYILLGDGGVGGKKGEAGFGADIQSGYALTDHWAVTAGYFSRNENDNDLDNDLSSEIGYRRRLFELGGGYFTATDKNKNVYFNMYGGVAFGEFRIRDIGKKMNGDDYFRYHNADIFKWYLQPGIRATPHNSLFSLSLLFRLSFVQYSDIRTSYTAGELDDHNLSILAIKKTQVFFEPTFHAQWKIRNSEWLRIEAGLCLAKNDNVDTRNGGFFLGCSIDFMNTKKKKK